MDAYALRPRLGSSRHSGRERFLLVCFFDPNGIATIYENIALWQRLSRYQIEVINLWPGRNSYLTLPSQVNLKDFDGIILHCTVSYSPENLFSLDRRLNHSFKQYDGIKVLMKQDEQRRINSFAKYLCEKAFDILITSVPPNEMEKVYPQEKVGAIRFVHALTGYVSPFMQAFNARSATERPLDISYRGSIQPLSFGRLGFEKRRIGEEVAAAWSGRSLSLDISSRWEDRIAGIKWFDFLNSSKAVLGVESGSNLFDFTGEVEAWCNEFCQLHQDKDQLSPDFYFEAHALYLKNYEDNVKYAQVSPRHFEAAATKTLQILYEGKYSGIFIPFRHYVPLRRDLANLDEVLGIVGDEERRAAITEAAFEEIVQNKRFQYDSFVSEVDNAIASTMLAKGRPNARDAIYSRRPKALVLIPHEPVLDPRIEWMAESLAQEYEVCEIGTYRFNESAEGPSVERISGGRSRIRVEQTRHDWDWLPAPRDLNHEPLVPLHQLGLLYIYAQLPVRIIARTIGAFDADEITLSRFRELCRHFVNTNSALIQAARRTGSFDVIVAAGLEPLPAALVLGLESKAVVVYDAHEYWPYSYLDFHHWENEFWAGLERSLARQATIRVTVSPPLASHMSSEYGCEFKAVPNCCPVTTAMGIDVGERLHVRAGNKQVDFLFQGLFAPGRGIEQLISAWPQVGAPARLLLRGPANPFKEEMENLAASLGIKGTRVLFPEAVSEDQLISAASEADVGIIPYDPQSPACRFACPNKLSQYLAAGLPIVSNDLDFVKSVVVANNLGAAVSFQDTEQLVKTIEKFTDRSLLRLLSTRAQTFFRSSFNWENVSEDLFMELRKALRCSRVRSPDTLDFSWVESKSEMRNLAAEPGKGGSFLELPLVEQSLLPPREFTPAMHRCRRAQLHNLLIHSRTRAMARRMIAPLPKELAHRVKTRLVLMLDRLN
jgi:glycosyltransferase involved in cell wall biosynthesis